MKRIALILMCMCSSVFAANTNFADIRQVRYDGNAEYTYFLSKSGWEVKNPDGSILCAPTYIAVKNDVKGKDQILSVGLAAYMANKNVQFYGDCTEGATYFYATYIVVGNT